MNRKCFLYYLFIHSADIFEELLCYIFGTGLDSEDENLVLKTSQSSGRDRQ